MQMQAADAKAMVDKYADLVYKLAFACTRCWDAPPTRAKFTIRHFIPGRRSAALMLHREELPADRLASTVTVEGETILMPGRWSKVRATQVRT